MKDLTRVQHLQVQIIREPDGLYKVWINTEAGCQLRAYAVEVVSINGPEGFEDRSHEQH